jgi:hypothetical protein
MIRDTIRQEIIAGSIAHLLETPDLNAVHMANLKSGDKIFVFGKYKDYILGKTFEGRIGWIPIL